MLAVTRGQRVGIDVEDFRPVREPSALIRQYFSRAEAEAIEARPPAHRLRAFLECWTRKEAVLKAVGAGLRAPLDVFAAPVGDTGLFRVTWCDAQHPSGLELIISDLSGEAIVAALAAERMTDGIQIAEIADLA